MQVADLGSGAGFFARAAARAVGEGGVVWAVDLNRELLSRIKNFAAAEGLYNVQVVHGDAEIVGGSNLPAESFDFVIAANLLFTVENKGEAIGEIRRLLKKTGRALVIDWQDSFGGLGPRPDHVVSAAQGKKLLEQHGMSVLGRVPAGAYHWGFVVRKKSA
jgi:ubiquinone/menaquinone biosynthesis C-methylase UbiE